MYTTDLSNTQWQYIKSSLIIEERKRKHDLREVWNAINYLVKTGCQWRMLPTNFPKWQLVYYYYSKWANLDYFDLLLEKVRNKVRVKMGQNSEPSLGIMDRQTVRWGNNCVFSSKCTTYSHPKCTTHSHPKCTTHSHLKCTTS